MKKQLLYTMLFISGLVFSQKDYTPYFTDPIFKNIMQSLADYGPNGNKDGIISANELRYIRDLDVSNKGINSLAGIEHCSDIWYLKIQGNNITELDLSAVTPMYLLNASNNKLVSVIIKNGRSNNVEANFTGNPNLKCIEVDANFNSSNMIPKYWKLDTGTRVSKGVSCSVVGVSSITVEGKGGVSELTKIGSTLQMQAAILPANADNKSVTWSVNTPSVATIDSATGVLTVRGVGAVEVTATAKDGTVVKGKTNITVTMIKTSTISVQGQGGATGITTPSGILQMEASVLPSNVTDDSVTWTVNNPSIAIIDKNGVLTAIKDGAVDVTATAKDGTGVSGKATITISGQPVFVSSIVVKGANGSNTITTSGGSLRMEATILPANSSEKSVKWSVSSGGVATITTSGVLKALRDGSVEVIATARDGSGVTGRVTITVSGQPTAPIVVFNDANFKKALIDAYYINTNGDKEIQIAEAYAYTGIMLIESKNIKNLTGIEAFVNLTQLKVAKNQLTSLDVSTLTKLEVLYCDVNKLTELDVSNNPALTRLNCSINPLVSLNVANGNNTALTMYATTTSLTCIQVDDPATIPTNWKKDPGVNYSTKCAASAPILVSSITVAGVNNTTKIETLAGTLQMQATVLPANTSNKSVIWSVNNSNVATIDANGVLTAVGDGAVEVTATAKDGSKVVGKATITVSGQDNTPSTVAVTSIVVKSPSSSITTKGGVLQFTAEVLPADASNKSVIWSVNNANVATIDANGVLTAVGDGAVEVTVTAKDGSKVVGKATITVSGQGNTAATVAVTSIVIKSSSSSITTKGGVLQFTAEVLPADASNKSVTWSVSDTSIATIDVGGALTAVGDGAVEVTATAKDGSKVVGKLTITVSGQASSVIAGDVDGNGVIDGSEIAGDVNGDGSIGAGEVTGDIDGNGSIGAGEVTGDIDGNGSIGAGEVTGDIDGDGLIGVGEVEGDVNGDGVVNDDDNVTSTVSVSAPKGFSPNGDTVNDTWEIKNIAAYANSTITIYSRSGREVYSGKATGGWNGNSTSGSLLPSGTYIYVINLNESGRNPVKGMVYINY